MKAKKLERALKNATSQSSTRPILQCVHYDPDGSITATDSHIMLRLDSMHSLKQPFNLNLQTFREEDGIYPDTLRLIPDNKTNSASFLLSAADITDVLGFLKALKTEVVTLAKADAGLTLKTKTQEYLLSIQDFKGALKKLSVTANNLFKCLQFYSDYLSGAQDKVRVSYYGDLSPVLFESKQATIVVTPVRVF
ncbi:hypothetical protein ACNAN0_03790 [Agrilactobacillus fermenti]|uniref:hypothetical protein n=1 Tax=Agrilactobacillus fermenti TaxID=2586909 RepID=UPI003A5BE464